MNRDNLFRRRANGLRAGEPPDWIPERSSDRPNGDKLRARIHSHQNVIPRKILLVEEDPYYVDVITEALAEGTVSTVSNWTHALRDLSREVYDLVIVSLGRHEQIDTMDLMRLMRYTGDELNFFTPFIAIVAEGYEWRLLEATGSGCISALQKPFTASMLRGIVIDRFATTPTNVQHRREN